MTRTVENIPVTEQEGEQRVDRWLRNHVPALTQGQIQKLVRMGQVRVDGKRVKADTRVLPGQVVRIPPVSGHEAKGSAPTTGAQPLPSARLVRDLLQRVLFRDEDVLVLDKPPGLAVQGGTGTKVHLDGALDALRFGSVHRPRLVHRLDRDTSGVLILGRTPEATRRLAESFRLHRARKYYWAVTLGRPSPASGTIEAALAKSRTAFEKMEHNEAEGRAALTHYHVVESAGKVAAWVALWPVTGRTHQLRAHLALINTPILGDPVYGQRDDFGLPKMLHLFARRLIVPHPVAKKGMIDVTAPVPTHFKATFAHFGFQGPEDGDPFRHIQGG